MILEQLVHPHVQLFRDGHLNPEGLALAMDHPIEVR
jgi:hypothetical protein